MTEENCREIIAVYEPQPQMKKLERMSLIGEFKNSEYDLEIPQSQTADKPVEL